MRRDVNLIRNDIHNLSRSEEILNHEYQFLTFGGYLEGVEAQNLMDTIEAIGEKIAHLKFELSWNGD